MEQRTEEWFDARAGKVTASMLDAVFAKKTTEAYKNYRAAVMAERLTGSVEIGGTGPAAQWGIDHEQQARANYTLETGRTVTETGFVDHPTIPMTGASPDGLVGEDGLVEIKCPKTATHIDYRVSGLVPVNYVRQMHWQMACTGRTWCDFVSYDPRLPADLRLWVKRIELDPNLLAQITEAVIAFLADVDATLAALTPEGEAA